VTQLTSPVADATPKAPPPPASTPDPGAPKAVKNVPLGGADSLPSKELSLPTPTGSGPGSGPGSTGGVKTPLATVEKVADQAGPTINQIANQAEPTINQTVDQVLGPLSGDPGGPSGSGAIGDVLSTVDTLVGGTPSLIGDTVSTVNETVNQVLGAPGANPGGPPGAGPIGDVLSIGDTGDQVLGALGGGATGGQTVLSGAAVPTVNSIAGGGGGTPPIVPLVISSSPPSTLTSPVDNPISAATPGGGATPPSGTTAPAPTNGHSTAPVEAPAVSVSGPAPTIRSESPLRPGGGTGSRELSAADARVALEPRLSLGAFSASVPPGANSAPPRRAPTAPPAGVSGAAASVSSGTALFFIFLALATMLALWLAGPSRRLRIARAVSPPVPFLPLLDRPG
jgi:hypothetical protein